MEPRGAIAEIGVPVVALLGGGAQLFVLARNLAGPAAGWSAAAATVLAIALLLAMRLPNRDRHRSDSALAEWLLVPVPAVLVLCLSFDGGGFFPGSKGLVAFLLALTLAARLALAPSPFAGFTVAGAISSLALIALTLWTLLSGTWSDSWGRAFTESSQTLVYALTVTVFASSLRSTRRLRWMVRGVVIAGSVVCICGLVTRLAPDVWPIAGNLGPERLSYPLTYWNAVGILAGITALLSLGISASTREPPLASVAAAAAVPVAATTLLLTFSRGAIAATAIGAVALIIAGRSRGLIGALVATLPTAGVAVATAYEADLLATRNPTTDAAVQQGHHVAWVLAGCALAAAVLRVALLPLDRRLAAVRFSGYIGRRAGAVAAVAVGAVLIAGAAAAGVFGQISDQYDRFVATDTVEQTGDLRTRLTDPGNNHRIDQWRVARRATRADPLTGYGAGTYQVLWAQQRPDASTVSDAHSLYFEATAELGFVGLLLLIAALGAILFQTLRRARGPNRSAYAAIFAAGVAWVAHAGVDWDWEMPAVTVPVLALGAAAVARSHRRRIRPPAAVGWRAAAVVAALALAVVPLLVTVSQHHLDVARAAARDDDCTEAIASARKSLRFLSSRAEPYQVIAYCEHAQGRTAPAVRDIRRAVERDPEFWRYRYDQSLIEAASGRDPRAAARAAAVRNPRELRVQRLVGGLATTTRSAWMRGGKRAIRQEAR